jgi:hypothetical protein
MILRSLTLFALLASVSGCETTIVGGGDGGCGTEECCDGADCNQGAGGTGAAGGSGGGVSNEGVAAPWESLGGEVAPAPAGTLLLSFANVPITCADPLNVPSCELEYHWEAQIPLPTALQYPGAVVDLDELLDVGFGPSFSDSQGDGNGLCSGGGGTLSGTLEVLAIDGASVTIRLSDSFGPTVSIDGERTLLRCGGGMLPATALVLTESQLAATQGGGEPIPPETGSSTSSGAGGGGGGGLGTGGGAPEPVDERLFVFVDDSDPSLTLTCSDPYAYDAQCQTPRRIVVVSLEPWVQAPGVYPMGGGSGVEVTISESGPNEDGSCWGGGGGGFTDGIVEILSIKGSQISLEITGGPVSSLSATALQCN